MDSTAYLKKHGWRGSGHSLHPTGRGITKPLLVSKKNNVLGVGKKKNDAHADQWWARAFDSGLKSLDINNGLTSKSREPGFTSSLGSLELVRRGGGRWAGLYSAFGKGQILEGTCDQSVYKINELDSDTTGTAHQSVSTSEEVAERQRKSTKRKRSKQLKDGLQESQIEDAESQSGNASPLIIKHSREVTSETIDTDQKGRSSKRRKKEKSVGLHPEHDTAGTDVSGSGSANTDLRVKSRHSPTQLPSSQKATREDKPKRVKPKRVKPGADDTPREPYALSENIEAQLSRKKKADRGADEAKDGKHMLDRPKEKKSKRKKRRKDMEVETLNDP